MLWHCWLGHLTRKVVSNVSSRTLHFTITYCSLPCLIIFCYESYVVVIKARSRIHKIILLREFLPRDAMQARPMPYAVSVCLSVRPSVCLPDSWILSKRINIGLSSFFSPSGSHTILVFPCQAPWQYFDGDPSNEASNAGELGRNRDSQTISGSIACCERLERQLQYTQLRRITLAAGKRRSFFCWRETTTKCMARNLKVTPKTMEQRLIVRSGKSEGEVANSRRLRSTYCTMEDNYWQSRSIARPL